MHELKRVLMDEIYDCEEKIKKSPNMKMSGTDLERLHILTDTVKNIDKIEMLEDGGYSEASEWIGEGAMRGVSYDGGESYARGRGRYAKRDSMGRYSRADGRVMHSYGDGKEHMISRLHEMMGEAENDKEREAIRRCIDQMRDI